VSASTPDTTAHAIRSATVFTHQRPNETAEGIQKLIAAARRIGVELRFDSAETAKHELGDFAADGVRTNARPEEHPDVCIVLGGDGATLNALRAYAGSGVPVFSVNYGRIGFLATADRHDIDAVLERALTGRFDVVQFPALVLSHGGEERFAINEVSYQRRSHLNMTHLTYSLGGAEVARVPCDGLIAATPPGSTGYNLSVGGPILAWGVKAYAVSLIAPHALSIRGLVAAPSDVLEVVNDGPEPVDLVIDGIRLSEMGVGERSQVRFRPDAVGLAQLPGSSFYRRFREKLLGLAR
jgi:NAD+ kinase